MITIQNCNKETEDIVDKMNEQYNELRKEYKNKLEEFEKHLTHEYESNRKKYKNTLSTQIKTEKDKERAEQNNRVIEDNNFYSQIENHIFDKMQIYSQSKIDIEEKIQKLQMYMEMNKAKIRLNQETIE